MLHQPDPLPPAAAAPPDGGGGGGGGPGPRGQGWREVARIAVVAVAGTALVIGLALQLFGGGGGHGGGHHDGHVGVEVVEAWTAPNPEALAVYLRLDNNGADDRLIDASSDRAGTVALMAGGELGHGADAAALDDDAIDLDVPPGSTELLPGGGHLMLTDLAGALEEGDSFPLQLTFEQTGAVDLTVEVVSWDEVVERS